MIKKTIIYDLDGTIINSSRDIIRSFNTAFKINNIKKINYEFFINNASRGSLSLIKQNLKKNQFFKLKKINEDFHKIYSSNCVKYTNCKIGLRWFLKKFENDYRHIICTNKKTKHAKYILKKLKINKYFCSIIGGDSYKAMKPSKKLYDLIRKKIIKNYKKIIMVGDSDVDAQFAKNSKSKFILVKNGYTNKKYKNIYKDFSINNFYDLNYLLSKKKVL